MAPIEGGVFVIEARTGARCKADSGRLVSIIDQHRSADPDGRNDHPRCFLVLVGTKGARSYSDLNGSSRVGKTEWGSKEGDARSTQIIEKNGTSSQHH